MRQQPLQEHHLHEAVRQKIITTEQYDAVLALARSMAQADGHAGPDLGWLGFFNAGLAGVVVGPAALWVLARHERWSAAELLFTCAALTALCVAGALAARRFSLGRPARGVFAAGAAMFPWGLGVAAYSLVTSHPLHGGYAYEGINYEVLRMHRDVAYLCGGASVLVAAAVVGRALRAPAAMGPAALALAWSVMNFAEYQAHATGTYLGEAQAWPWLMAISAALVPLAFVVEKRQGKRYDPAFWLHAVGILPLGAAGMIVIDRANRDALAPGLLFLALAGAVVALGARFERRSYLAAGAAALLVYPAMIVEELHWGHDATLFAFVASGVVLSALGVALRGHFVRRWLDRSAPRVDADATVWAA